MNQSLTRKQLIHFYKKCNFVEWENLIKSLLIETPLAGDEDEFEIIKFLEYLDSGDLGTEFVESIKSELVELGIKLLVDKQKGIELFWTLYNACTSAKEDGDTMYRNADGDWMFRVTKKEFYYSYYGVSKEFEKIGYDKGDINKMLESIVRDDLKLEGLVPNCGNSYFYILYPETN